MPTNITMKGGEVITLGFSEDYEELELEAQKVIENYCGSEFSRWYTQNTLAPWERENDDPENFEAQNEEYAEGFREISNILYEYRTKVFEVKSKLYRKDLEAMMSAIGSIVDEMI